jgi:signal transduction histidine kinase
VLRLPRTLLEYKYIVESYSILISCIVIAFDLFIGGYVLYNNPRKIVHWAFFSFAGGIGLLGLGFVLLFSTHNFTFDKLIFFGGHFTILGLTLLSVTFPNKALSKKFWFAMIPLGGLFIATPFNLIVKGISINNAGVLEPINGPGIGFFVFIVGGYIFFSIVAFLLNYHSSTGKARVQIQYLILGVILFALSLFFFNVLLPAIGYSSLNLLGPDSSIVFVVLTAYAIVRHQLMDIRVVVQRGAIYVFLFTLVVLAYLFLVISLGFLFQRATDITALWSAALVTLVGIFGVPPLEKYFRKLTDPIFFKDQYDYSSALQDLSQTLHTHIGAEEVAMEAVRKLKAILKVDRLEILLAHNIAHEESAGMELPIELGGETLGHLRIGKKLSGEPYWTQDMTLLQTFTYQLAIALSRSRLYERVRRYSLELEDKVRERTAEIQRLQEEQKQMMMEISHNLQSPLSVLKGELGFLKKRVRSKDHLDVFEKSIDRISKFIYDLLKLARLEMNREEIHGGPADASAAMAEFAEYFKVIGKEQGIELSTRIEPGVKLYLTKDHLEELIANLISNSFKYMSNEREKRVSLALMATDNMAEISVTDTGIGIKEEDQPYIFHRFYRVSDHAAAHIKGTGLGLAICKKIAEKYGGRIEVQSKYGTGATFRIILPLAPSETK